MVLRVYVMICTIVAVAAAAMFVSGNFSVMAAVVFGFIAFGVVFMGMMFVLPFTVTHSVPATKNTLPTEEPVAAPSYGRSQLENLHSGLVRHVR
jgi:hypothetical protein